MGAKIFLIEHGKNGTRQTEGFGKNKEEALARKRKLIDTGAKRVKLICRSIAPSTGRRVATKRLSRHHTPTR